MPLHFFAQPVAQVLARHAECDVGAQETRLRAAIVPLALELDAIETLAFGEPDHGVGQLYFTAGTALVPLEDLKDFRLQDVAAGDRQVRGRGSLGRLLDHAVDLENIALALAYSTDAVLMRAIRRHFLHRNQIGFVAELARSLDHLLEAARRVQHQLIRQQHRERLVADDIACAPNRMAETERRLLAGETHRAGFRLVALQNLHFGFLAAGFEGRIEFKHPVEMILDHALVAAGDKDEMLDASLFGFIDHVLDQWLVDDGQHFLWHGLGGGQNAGAEASDRENSFADFHGGYGCLAETCGDRMLVAFLQPGTKPDVGQPRPADAFDQPAETTRFSSAAGNKISPC